MKIIKQNKDNKIYEWIKTFNNFCTILYSYSVENLENEKIFFILTEGDEFLEVIYDKTIVQYSFEHNDYDIKETYVRKVNNIMNNKYEIKNLKWEN